MRHIFKANASGSYKTEGGFQYDCKCVNTGEAVPKGWSKSLDEAQKKAKKAAKVEVATENTESAQVAAQV